MPEYCCRFSGLIGAACIRGFISLGVGRSVFVFVVAVRDLWIYKHKAFFDLRPIGIPEAIEINKALTALGDVIESLTRSPGRAPVSVP